MRSGPVTLAFGLEPVDDGDTNPDSNLTVDFGFVPETGGGFLADICLGQTIPFVGRGRRAVHGHLHGRQPRTRAWRRTS